ncbi:MAG: AMP-binding protein [Mycolicibacterium insubricum]|nr:AMP-binding protein [Mycobacterium sp.]
MTTALADALATAAIRTPQRVLLIDEDVRLDAAGTDRAARTLAAALLRRFEPGSVVSFMLPNWHEAAIVYLGATLAGMVVNPILPSLRDRELRYILEDTAAAMIVIPGLYRGHDYPAMLARVTADLPTPPEVVVVRGDDTGFTGYHGLFSGTPLVTLPGVDPDAVALLLYTSGTTAAPKGVLHSQRGLRALLTQIGRYWRVEDGDTFLVASPIAHIGGSIYAFEAPLLLGSTAVLMQRWDPDAAVALIQTHRCTHMAGATPFLTGLLDAARRFGSRLPELKVFICGGASVPPSLVLDATDYFDKAVVTRVYGSTEVPVTTVGSPDPGDTEHAAHTDGRAGIAELRIVDGEIRCRGPQMLLGYRNARDTADAFDDDGFFRTGDLGRIDDGYLVVTGRCKDLIIRNGENISPKEIEDLLATAPGIGEVAVVGIPDPRTGERACAVIVPDDRAPVPDLAALRTALTDAGLALFKVPERVEIWESLPRNDAGKILKQQIRATLCPQTREG